jgi:serine/threonine-protein kinase
VNPATDTVYVANTGQLFTTADGNTVSVINGATCNSSESSGCGQAPTTVAVGRAPFGVAVDQATNVIYVVNNQGGESDATLSTIDGIHCDGTDVSGCVSARPSALGPGRAPNGIAFDPATRTLFTANFSNATMSAVNLAALPGKLSAQRFAVGSAPEALALDSADHTVYVSNTGDGTVSVVGT